MRLIDADEFANTLKKISDANWFKKEQKEAFETIVGLLIGVDKEKYSPTAYAEDKVVEELKDLGSKYCINVGCKDECQDCSHGILMQKAIEIVKNGLKEQK